MYDASLCRFSTAWYQLDTTRLDSTQLAFFAFPPRKHGIWYLKWLLFLVPPRSRFQAAEPMLKGDVGRRPATDWPESVTKSRERHGNHAGNSHSSAAANIFHFFNMPANNTNTNTIASMFSIVVMWVLSMCGLRRCCLGRVQKYVTALSRSRPRPRPGGTICGGKGPALLPCRVVSSRVVSSRATCAVEKRHKAIWCPEVLRYEGEEVLCGEERLSDLLLLAIEKYININHTEVINIFKDIALRRMLL